MKKLLQFIVISLLFIIYSVSYATSNAKNATDNLKNATTQENPKTSLADYLINIRTMQADFSQRISNKSAKTLQHAEGSMYIQRPGLFRWEVKSPIAQLIIANHKKLWIYDKDLEQVTIRSFQRAKGEAPALLLSESNPNIEKDFTIKNPTRSTGIQWFTLIPKDPSSLFIQIKIGFDHQNLHEMQLYDHMGQINIIHFHHTKTNQPLGAALFTLKIPPHVDVINETRA